TITATSAPLLVETGTIAVSIRAKGRTRVSMTLRGAPLLALPADRTTVRGMLGALPAFELQISAGDHPSITAPHADRLEIDAPRIGNILLTSTCDRPILIRPTPRGSTSVFLARMGPSPATLDPLFWVADVEARASRSPCSAASTSTLSVTHK